MDCRQPWIGVKGALTWAGSAATEGSPAPHDCCLPWLQVLCRLCTGSAPDSQHHCPWIAPAPTHCRDGMQKLHAVVREADTNQDGIISLTDLT